MAAKLVCEQLGVPGVASWGSLVCLDLVGEKRVPFLRGLDLGCFCIVSFREDNLGVVVVDNPG